jgi:Fe-S cluster biogenesis protein NfuA
MLVLMAQFSCGELPEKLYWNRKLPGSPGMKWIFFKEQILKEKVVQVLDSIRGSLQADGGDVELVEVIENEGIVRVRLTGACGGCPMSQMTLQMGIERIMKQQVPEVKRVVAVTGDEE